MTIQLFANNAKTTLAAPITSTQTTITVASGTGALFPNPTTGQQFKITLVSAASASVYEICNCTAISGDTLTVLRGQEGTSGQPFILNDIVGNFDTAGVMTDLVQSEQLQNGYYLFAVATGSANALTATLPSNLTSLPNGMSITVLSAYANTGAATLNLTLGSTSTGVIPIVTGNNTPLTAGVIPNAGYPITLSYSSTFNAWVITDGQIDLSLYAPKASPTLTGTPQAPTYSPPAPTAPSPTTQIATLGYVYNSLQNYAPIFSPTLTGTPVAPTAPIGTATTQIATTKFANPNTSIGTNGYVEFPGGIIIQWGFVYTTIEGLYTATFPIPFPNAVFNVQATPNFNSDQTNGDWNTVIYQPITTSSCTFWQNLMPAAAPGTPYGFSWLAIGF